MYKPCLILAMAAGLALAQPANFGEVEKDHLYRSGQPTAADLLWLAGQGFSTVVDLRKDQSVRGEELMVHQVKLEFISLPVAGLAELSHDQIQQLRNIVASRRKILLHCQYGKDRTSMAVAVIRIDEGWTNQMAMAEAKFYGIHWLAWPARHFIRHFHPPHGVQLHAQYQ
jgi:protein tyrosine/serine phosphatase